MWGERERGRDEIGRNGETRDEHRKQRWQQHDASLMILKTKMKKQTSRGPLSIKILPLTEKARRTVKLMWALG